ncbi:4-hydroxy-tetrahydrodipicolinate reductase [Dehalococcoidia bacterium]|nr:4-hydroxy-tetrahydrodipicolinate reductase [Dehalococcoidia bacterium]
MAEYKVVVHGILGKMGQAVLAAVDQDDETVPVAGVDAAAVSDTTLLPIGSETLPLFKTIEDLPDSVKPQVLVDFSVAGATMPAIRWAASRGINFVVGTTGLTARNQQELKELATRHRVGGIVASNFALGAVVLMYLSQKAAPYFNYAEIIETHHETKVDSPSGTSLAIAGLIEEAADKPFQRNEPERQTIPGTRTGAVGGVTIHSVRLPGRLAHHEVIFGAPGQTLHIKHDTINRECYQPGILMAVKHVAQNQGLLTGLDQLLGLGS